MENFDLKAARAALNEEIIDMEEINADLEASAEQVVTSEPVVLLPQTVAQLNYGTSRVRIAQLKDQYKGLIIAGLQDKDGYKTVSSNLKALEKMRTGIENKRKEMKRPVIDAGALIDTEAKELTALLNEVIKPLDEEVKRIDKLAEDEKLRVFRELKALKDDRLEALKTIGFTFDGEYWKAGPDVSVLYDNLGAMNALAFGNLCDLGLAAIKAIEKAKQEEAERVQKLEDSRVAMRGQVLELSGYQSSALGWFLPHTRLGITLDQVKNLEDVDFMQKIAEQKKQAAAPAPAPVQAPAPTPANVEQRVVDIPFKAKDGRETNYQVKVPGNFAMMVSYLNNLLAVPVPQFSEGSRYAAAIETIRNYIQKNVVAVKEAHAKYSKQSNQ